MSLWDRDRRDPTTSTSPRLYIYRQTYVCLSTYIHTNPHAVSCMSGYIHTDMHICLPTNILCFTISGIFIFLEFLDIWGVQKCRNTEIMYVCRQVWMSHSMSISCMHEYVCMHVCMYVCTCIYLDPACNWHIKEVPVFLVYISVHVTDVCQWFQIPWTYFVQIPKQLS